MAKTAPIANLTEVQLVALNAAVARRVEAEALVSRIMAACGLPLDVPVTISPDGVVTLAVPPA